MQIILDKPRNLRFNVNSLRWLEVELGDGREGPEFILWFLDKLSSIVRDSEGNPVTDEDGNLKRVLQVAGWNIRTHFLWACLRHEDPALTVEQVGALLTPENLNQTYEACLEAFNEFYQPKGSSRPLSEGSPGMSGGVSAATISD